MAGVVTDVIGPVRGFDVLIVFPAGDANVSIERDFTRVLVPGDRVGEEGVIAIVDDDIARGRENLAVLRLRVIAGDEGVIGRLDGRQRRRPGQVANVVG